MIDALRHCSAVNGVPALYGVAVFCANAEEFAPPSTAAAVTPDSAARKALRVTEDDRGIVSSTKNLKGRLCEYLCYL